MKLPQIEEVDCALAQASLFHFTKQMWPVLEQKEFLGGWHIEMICEHLEAVSAGQIKRLIINVPPRHMKSLTTSVFWPMQDWLKNPERQFLFSSYAHNLSIRDSVKSRRVFQSKKYQGILQHAQPDLVLVGDQNTKIRFENNMLGYRLATSVDGATTGEGGDIIVVDDAHNVKDGESETKRVSTLEWWDEVMQTRLHSPKTGAFVVIMQRVHQEDLTGHILAKEHGWDHVCLPARYEGRNRVVSSIGAKDPRTEIDEALWPIQYGNKELSKLERSLGSYGTAGQLQQRPSPRGGGMMKVEKIKLIDDFNPNFIVRTVRYWDKAGTEDPTNKKKSARSAGVLIHLMKTGNVIISDAVKGKWSYLGRENRIKQVAELDAGQFGKAKVQVWTEQEPGSGGKESAERTVRMLVQEGYVARSDRPAGDKITRAQPISAAIEAEMVSVVKGEWVHEFLAELESFPTGTYKDQVDALSAGYNKVTQLGEATKSAGTWGKRRY